MPGSLIPKSGKPAAVDDGHTGSSLPFPAGKMSTSFEIDRVPWGYPWEDFEKNYFQPEKPVVFEGLGQKVRRTDDLSIESIRERIVEKGLASVNTSWFEGPSEMLELLVDTPEVVSRPMSEAHLRKNHCRLWLNGAGNLTPSHYDGNMLFVFNLQLKGRKEWRIVSPHTPLANYPFSRGAIFDKGGVTRPTQKNIEFCEFALEEGDMVYLPPLWHHSVKATADANVNVNWVGTRKTGHMPSKTLTREKELLRWARVHKKLTGSTKFPNLALGAGIKNYVENYAGVGWDFVDEFTRGIGFHRVILRFLKELGTAPAAIKDRKRLKKQLAKKPLDSVKKKPEPEPAAA